MTRPTQYLMVRVNGHEFSRDQFGKNSEVFARAIAAIGLAEVAELKLTLSGAPLVSRQKAARSSKKIDGWFVATYSNTAEKHSVLLSIQRLLKNDLQAEVLTEVEKLLEL